MQGKKYPVPVFIADAQDPHFRFGKGQYSMPCRAAMPFWYGWRRHFISVT